MIDFSKHNIQKTKELFPGKQMKTIKKLIIFQLFTSFQQTALK